MATTVPLGIKDDDMGADIVAVLTSRQQGSVRVRLFLAYPGDLHVRFTQWRLDVTVMGDRREAVEAFDEDEKKAKPENYRHAADVPPFFRQFVPPAAPTTPPEPPPEVPSAHIRAALFARLGEALPAALSEGYAVRFYDTLIRGLDADAYRAFTDPQNTDVRDSALEAVKSVIATYRRGAARKRNG